MKIRDLLTDESKWAKGDYAFDEKGEFVHPESKYARSFCLLGAAKKIYTTDRALSRIKRKINKYVGPDSSAIIFNDDPSTTFADIRKLVEELDI